MMNEYLLYKDGVYFGGIFDDRLLVKMTKSGEKYAMNEQLPYEGAKPMYFVDCVDEQNKLCAIISEVTEDLKKNPKKKKLATAVASDCKIRSQAALRLLENTRANSFASERESIISRQL